MWSHSHIFIIREALSMDLTSGVAMERNLTHQHSVFKLGKRTKIHMCQQFKNIGLQNNVATYLYTRDPF